MREPPPPLPIEHELELVRSAKKGDAAALDALVRRHMGFIVRAARAGYTGALPVEDLVQEGVVGFLEGLARFDCDRQPPVRVLTYTSRWIERNIRRASLASDARYGGAPLPERVYHEVGLVRRAERAFSARTGRAPSPREIAAEAGLPLVAATALGELRARHVLSLARGPHAAEAPDGDGAGLDPADPEAGRVLERLIRDEEVGRVRTALGRLPPPEATYLRRRYGIEDAPARGARRATEGARGERVHARAIAALRRFVSPEPPQR